MRSPHQPHNSHHSNDVNNAHVTNTLEQNKKSFVERNGKRLMVLIVVAVVGVGLVAVRSQASGFGFRWESVIGSIFADKSDAGRQYPEAPSATCTSIASGAWNVAGNWTNCGGTFPGAADAAIIDNGTTITLDTTRTVASATVNSGSTLDAAANTLTVSGTFTLVPNSTFKQGGGVTTPPGTTRSFDSASTFIYNGTQTSITGFFTFGNLTWSAGNSTPGGNLTINGNLTVTTNTLRGSTGTGTPTRTHTVSGNVIIDGATAVLIGTNATAAGTGTWNIAGNVTTQNGGILRGCNTGATADGTFNIGGNLINNGTVEHGTGTGVFTLNFNGTSAQAISGNAITSLQTVTISNTSNTVTSNVALTSTGTLTVNANASLTLASTYSTSSTTSVSGTLTLGGSFSTSSTFNVASGGVLNCGTNILSGTGVFNLQPGGTLGIGSPNGIVALFPPPGLSGNIQTTGNRIFNSLANYTYNGTSAQVTGTGPGFNSTQGTVNSLTITNTAGVTLSQNTTFNGASSIGSGATLNTGAFALTVSNTLTNSGTLNVSSGGTIKGTGTVSGPVNVNSGGTVAPGNSAGILNTGSVTFSSGATYAVEIGGTTAGTDYDQLNVTGTVTLGSATLNLSAISFTPVAGNSFTIINNDSADAVAGNFTMGTGGTDSNGGTLAEGDSITNFLGSGLSATISYAGGTNSNDVVITVPVSLKYRSRQTGTWNDFNSWEVDTGGGFVNAIAGQTPTSADDTIQIRNAHNLTVSASVNADQLTVDSGGQLTIQGPQTLTIDNGTGTDLTNNGTIFIGATGFLAGAGSLALNTGSTVNILSMTGGFGGQVTISGGITAAPGDATTVGCAVNYGAGNAQIIDSASHPTNCRLSVSNTNTKTLNGPITIAASSGGATSTAGAISVGTGSTFGDGGFVVTLNPGSGFGNVVVTGTYSSSGGKIAYTSGAGSMIQAPTTTFGALDIGLSSSTDPIYLRAPAPATTVTFSFGDITFNGTAGGTLTLNNQGTTNVTCGHVSLSPSVTSNTGGGFGGTAATTALVSSTGSLSSTSTATTQPIFNNTGTNKLAMGGAGAKSMTFATDATFFTGSTLQTDATGGVQLPFGRTMTLGVGGEVIIPAFRSFITANMPFHNNGTVTVNGTFLIQIGAWASSGTGTYNYDQTTGVLDLSSGSPETINSASTFWPATNGPQTVRSLAFGTVNITVPRTVGILFQTASPITSANNLTINGTLRIFFNGGNAGTITGGPTYGPNALLQYNTSTFGNYGRGDEWSATSGAGFPNDVQITNNSTLNLGNGGSATARAIARDLTIDGGSTLSMNITPMTAALTVGRHLLNNGTLTLSGSSGGDLNVAGNVTNNGTYTHNGRTLNFTGNGNQSWAGASTDFGAVGIVNSGSANINLSTAISVQTLALSLGYPVTTSSNLLTVTNTSVGAIAGGSPSSFVNGPLARNLPASLVAGSTYSWPIGKGAFKPFALVDPTTNAGGGITVQAEVFDGNSGGTAGTGLSSLRTDRYWSASITANSGNFTNASVSLTESGLGATNRIGKSATQSGTYDSIGGTVLGSTITSDPITSFSFFNIGTAAVTPKYRSRQSGNWNDFNTWEVDTGSGFVNAGSGQTPTSADDTIEIRNVHMVGISASVTADQVTINSGGTLNVQGGNVLTLNDGAGTDLTNNGILGIGATGSIAGAGSIALNIGSNTNILTMTGGFGAQVTNTGGVTAQPGDATNVGCNVSYAAGNAQVIDAASHPSNCRLTVSNLNTKTLNGNITINASSGGATSTSGALNVITGSTFADGGFTITLNPGSGFGNVVVSGTYSSSGGKIAYTSGAGSMIQAPTTTFGNLDIGLSSSTDPIYLRAPAPATTVAFSFGNIAFNGTAGGTLTLNNQGTTNVNCSHISLTPSVTSNTGGGFGGTAATTALVSSTGSLSSTSTATTQPIFNNTGTNKLAMGGAGAKSMTFATDATFFTGSTLQTDATGGVQLPFGRTMTLGVGGEVIIPAFRSFITANMPFHNNGTVTANGTFLIQIGAWASSGTGTYNYDQTTGVLDLSSGSPETISSASTFWPATNGPQTVRSLAFGTVNITVPRTVGILFQTASPITSANNLTINGTLRIFFNGGNAGTITGGPTYGPNAVLQYNTSTFNGGVYNRGDEWSATSGAGFPNDVHITNNTTLNLGFGGAGTARAIARDLTIDSGSALSMNITPMTAALTVGRNLLNNGSLVLSSLSGGDLIVGGNTTNNGTFMPNGATVTFNGSLNQNVGGTGANDFAGLAMNGAGGITLTAAASVSGALTLTSGNINTGSNSLTLGNAATTTGASSSSYVIGNLKKTAVPNGSFNFPVGTANGYTPLSLANATGGGDLTVSPKTPQQPVLTAGTSLQEYWTLIEGGTVTADLTFSYLESDVMGNEANYRIVVVEGGNATSFPADANHSIDTVGNTFTKLGVQTFSDWTIAEPNAPTAVKLTSFNAVQSNGEVMLQWRTGYEAHNLGYVVYREQNGKRTAITPSLVAGSALLAGRNTQLTSGLSYTWYDQIRSQESGVRSQKSNPQSAIRNQQSAVTYWLEDVDLNGTRTLHGPIAPVQVYSLPAKGGKLQRADLIGEVGQRGRTTVTGVELRGGPAGATAADRALSPASDEPDTMDPMEMQRTIAGLPGLKLSVSRPGWYRLTQPQVLAAGFNIADANGLQLYRDGRQVALRLSNSNEQFGPTDYLEFYGEGLNSTTDTAQTYYLVKLAEAGRRIEVKPQVVGPGDRVSPEGFAYTVERKERMIYFSSLLNGDAENFFGQIVSPDAITATLPINHLDPGATAPAQLEVSLQGVSNQSHLVQVRFNGTDLGTLNFANTDHPTQTLNVPAALLLDGDNNVELTALGGPADVSLVDVLRLTYVRKYQVDNNALSFNLASRQVKRLNGFTSDQLTFMDVTDPYNVQQLTPHVMADGAGFAALIAAEVEVRAPFSRPHYLLAFGNGQAEPVDAVRLNEPSSWWSQTAGADYLMITTSALKASVEPLAQLRRNQGQVVNVIDVEDVYDEFSFGQHTPQALRDLIQTAQNTWVRKPHFVLLAGDASYDPKNYFGQGSNDLVPTKLVDTALNETASDDWLADFNADGLTDLAVGRLPVRTAADLNLMVSKIINYENSAPDPSRGALLVADTSFEGQSAAVQSLIPAGMPVATVNRGSMDDATARAQILAGLNQGPRVANYFGHGSNGVWTGASLLSSDDAPFLTNTNRLSVYTMMTCYNGFFQDAWNESLSEALLKAQGGAVAVWASTTLTDPSGQNLIDQEFYRQVFGAVPATLGDASRAAKATTGDPDVRRTWTLFGDPAMKLQPGGSAPKPVGRKR